MAIQQISVFLENRPSQLANMTDILRKNDIDMRALSLSETSDFGIVRLIVDKPEAAIEVLKKENYIANLTPVLAVEMNDEAGGLYAILKILSDAGINLEYTYAFVTRKKGLAYTVIRVDNEAKAAELFRSNGIPLIETESIEEL